jgi:DNA-binding NarL/FixJ family response regulator
VTIRLLLAEDNVLLREGLVKLLGQADHLEVVGACGSLDELYSAVEADPPDVVLTDIRMPPTHSDEGIRAAALFGERGLSTGVVVLSQYAEPEFVLGLLEKGSARRAYLLKERVHHRGQLLGAVRAVHEGGSHIDPKLVEVLVEGRSRAAQSPLRELTPRELETLGEIAQGKSNEAIAQSLFLTKRAVEKHINSIFMKLNLVTDGDISRRVKATLLFLADTQPQPDDDAFAPLDGGQ